MNLPYEQARHIVDKMTTRQKIGQMLMASIEVTSLDDKTSDFLKKNAVGNIILFGKNCTNRAQIAALNAQLHAEIAANTGVQPLISIDQEGGVVTRIHNGATVFPSAMAIGSTNDPDNAYLAGYIMGAELRDLGIYINCAPVLDINLDDNNPIVGLRSYGATKEKTALFGGAAARGMRHAGIIDCGKHFPGHGYTRVDTHFDFGVDNASLDELKNEVLMPFKQVIKEGMRSIMVTHMSFPALEPAVLPSSLSKRVLQDLLRKELGFEGLAISDGMQMHAISKHYGSPQGCVMAAQAGCDLIICGNGGNYAAPDAPDVQTPCIDAMNDAVEKGELSIERINESALRIVAFKLTLGDMSPAKNVAESDWQPHEAFARALTRSACVLLRDRNQLLPLPKKALFISEAPKALLGVAEGDHIAEGFAPVAARLLHGEAFEYQIPADFEKIFQLATDVGAIVVGVKNLKECTSLMPYLESLYNINVNLCVVCMNAPYVLKELSFIPCTISCYDQTPDAILSACQLMKTAFR